MIQKRALQYVLSAALSATLLLASACHSYHIDTTIENRTGGPVRLLEVDYPDASFGTDVLTTGSDFHYRIQVQGSGQLKINYTAANNTSIHIEGPQLAQRQQGRLEIVLLPGGKAEFHPSLTHP